MMETVDYRRTNNGYPIIFRIARKRGVEGSVDSDMVIGDRRGMVEHEDSPGFVLYLQRLDNGATAAGDYSNDLTGLIKKAVRLSYHPDLITAFQELDGEL